MFAVVETGGKQYKVRPGQTVEVEKLPALPGDTVELGRVLLISTDDNQTLIGTPTLEDAKVVAQVAQLKRGPKIVVFRYKSKARYRRKTGHRQDYTALTIADIWANGASLLPAKEAEASEPEAEETAVLAAEDEAAEAEQEEAAEMEAEEAAEAAEMEEPEAATPEPEAAAPEPPTEPPEGETKPGRRRGRKGKEE